MSTLVALGWIAIMLLIGIILKHVSTFLRNMLVPASVIGGILGLIVANTIGYWGGESGGNIFQIESSTFSTLVTHLFTLSFISIGLVGIRKGGGKSGSTGKSIFRGAMGMGIVWVILYTLTASMCAAILLATYGVFDFDPLYGLLIPFAFCQGPGQAATFGAIFESYGVSDSINIGVTYAAIGFIVAFAVGVPLAKAGIRKGYAKHLVKNGEVKESVLEEKGALDMPAASEEKPAHTQGSGAMDALTFSFILIGLTYVLTYFLTALFARIFPSISDTLWGLMFMSGMLVGYGVKAILNKTKLSTYHDTAIQQKISNWLTDFLVCAAFMAVSLSAIKDYALPILLVSLATSVVTYFACIYFGHRFGDENDFERTLGLWGTATGTVPCGVALARIVDPETRTTTNIELGLMNLPMFFSTPSLLIMLAAAAGTMDLTLAIGLLLIPIPILLILLKVFGAWGKKTY